LRRVHPSSILSTLTVITTVLGCYSSMSKTPQVVHPSHWKATKGYSAGMIAEGRQLFIAGQIGWDAQQVFHSDDLIEQFTLALDNILDVLKAANGEVEHITEMTVYVTDLKGYRQRYRELGPIWRERLGRHFPAMALVGVAGLVEERALVEIQARAVLPTSAGLPVLPTSELL
jgi:enamine deaminase RidA (YjgF/YER057c/UK114 family)